MLLFAPLLLALVAQQAAPFRSLSFDDALAAAAKEKKLVLVDFRSEAEASRKLEKMTFGDSGVRSFLKAKVVAIAVDLAGAGDLAARFRVETAPTLLFVDADGMEVDRYAGHLTARQFLDQARGTIAGKDGLFRLRARIQAGEKDPRVRLELAELLIERGRHAEALEELLVCFDRGAVDDPTFDEIRGTAVLQRIHRLGQVHPEALTKLAERSDAAKKRVLAGAGSPGDVDEVIRIDRELERVERLTSFYDQLREKPGGTEARRRLAPHVVVVMIADRRYAEALECVGDPAAELEKRIAACAAGGAGAPPSPEETEKRRRDAVAIGAEYVEILLGAGQVERADAIVDRLLAFEPKVATYERLIEHAARAGASKKGAAIGRRGITSLPAPADRARLRVVVSGLPER